MNRYLGGDCIPWLLEKTDADIRYLTMRDVVPERFSAAELDDARTELRQSNALRRIIVSAGEGGILGDTAHFDIFYRGAMWYFAEAVERGLDRRDAVLERTAEFLFDRCRKPSGGFILNWKPEIEVACRTGDMIRHLIRAGYDDERVKRGIDWIVARQRPDGGWLHCPLSGPRDLLSLMMFKKSGTGLDREGKPGVPSCIFASAACLNALVLYHELHPHYAGPIANAAEFLLSHRMFLHVRRDELPVCLGEYREGDFLLPGYPVLSQYDILYGLVILSRAGMMADRRTGEAFNLLLSKQNDDGSWNLENARTGMLEGGKRKNATVGTKSKWVTLGAMRLFRCAGMLDV